MLFANSLDPDQDQQSVSQDMGPLFDSDSQESLKKWTSQMATKACKTTWHADS